MLELLLLVLIGLLFIGLVYWIATLILPPPIPAIVAAVLTLIVLIWLIGGVDLDSSRAAVLRL